MKVTTCDYCGKFSWTSGVLDSNYYQSKDIWLMKCEECGCDYCDVCIIGGPYQDDFEMLEECCIADHKRRRNQNDN